MNDFAASLAPPRIGPRARGDRSCSGSSDGFLNTSPNRPGRTCRRLEFGLKARIVSASFARRWSKYEALRQVLETSAVRLRRRYRTSMGLQDDVEREKARRAAAAAEAEKLKRDWQNSGFQVNDLQVLDPPAAFESLIQEALGLLTFAEQRVVGHSPDGLRRARPPRTWTKTVATTSLFGRMKHRQVTVTDRPNARVTYILVTPGGGKDGPPEVGFWLFSDGTVGGDLSGLSVQTVREALVNRLAN